MKNLEMKFLLLCSLPVLAHGLLGFIGTTQSVAVTGQLLCNGMPASSVKVKLYDQNTFSLDNFLDQENTDGNGNFYLQGHETDITTMDPKFNIYHKCNYNGLCDQKVSILIPSSYVTDGSSPQKTYNVGNIELSGTFSGQTTDCLNK